MLEYRKKFQGNLLIFVDVIKALIWLIIKLKLNCWMWSKRCGKGEKEFSIWILDFGDFGGKKSGH